MNKHPHAELMKLYVEDVMITSKPWDVWEFQLKDEAVWHRLTGHPAWSHEAKYRRRTRVVEIDGVKFPIPAITASDYSANRSYFTMNVTHFGIVVTEINRECISADRFNTLLEHGLIFEQFEECARYVAALRELNKKIINRFYEDSEKEN